MRDDSELLAYLSHEVRTGLHAILGHAELLRLSKLKADEARSVERVIDVGLHLAGILDEVGELAAGELRPERVAKEPIDLGTLLAQLGDLLGPLAAANGASVGVGPVDPDATRVVANRQRLTQILLNLLSNAIKYGGGRIEVSASRTADEVVIAVADSGPGIDPDRVTDVFEPFERLDAEGGARPGNGIGLALSQRIAELSGARLSVRSTLGQGATFTVALPAISPDARPPDRAYH